MGFSSALASIGSWISANAGAITAVSGAAAAAGTTYAALSAPGPAKPPQLPAQIAQPPPVDQTQLQQQQSFAQQMANRGRASTVLTNQPDQSKLGS